MITGTRYDGAQVVLVEKSSGRPIHAGTVTTTFRDEVVVITGARPPHKPSSTGRVYCREQYPNAPGAYPREFFPSVVRAEWRLA